MEDVAQRVVIKVGTGVLTRDGDGTLNHAMLGRIIQAVSDLVNGGCQVVMVSSGAVGAGMSALDLKKRPEDVGLLQACAAVGQARLMEIYDNGFRNYHLKVAQLLLTNEDFDHDRREANVRNTLDRLLDYRQVIPIINENDSVAVYELRFGDNDLLSTHVAQMVKADQLILMTSVPGLRRPDSKDENDIVTDVENLEAMKHFADGTVGERSVGGMASKLKAVEIAVNAGIETIIASGHHPEQVAELVAGGGFATRFRAAKIRTKS